MLKNEDLCPICGAYWACEHIVTVEGKPKVLTMEQLPAWAFESAKVKKLTPDEIKARQQAYAASAPVASQILGTDLRRSTSPLTEHDSQRGTGASRKTQGGRELALVHRLQRHKHLI